MSSSSDRYKPQVWEKILAFFSAGLILFTALFLVIRNKSFADPNLVVLMRTLVSFAVAVIGAVIPGFLNIDWSPKGATVRAGGALALFVLTFVMTPSVISSEDLSNTPETSSDLSYLEFRLERQRVHGSPTIWADVYNAGKTTIDLFYMVVVMSNYSISPPDLSETKLVSILDVARNLKPGETRRIGGNFRLNNDSTWMENIPENYIGEKLEYVIDWGYSFDSNELFVSQDELSDCPKERNCSAKLLEIIP